MIEKGYLVITKGNNYEFNEISVITKEDNTVITKGNNDVITKSNNPLSSKDIRNNTNNTYNNTNNNTVALAEANDNIAPSLGGQKPKAKFEF